MRIGALLGIAAIAACAEYPSPVAPRAIDQAPTLSAAVESNEQVRPFRRRLWISCANEGAGENVTLSGELVIRSHLVEDENGGSHLWTFFRPSNVVGVGASSGLRYRGTGETFEGEVYASDGAPAVYTMVNNFRIIGQGPGNNLLMHMVVHQTWNADGELVADVDFSDSSCK